MLDFALLMHACYLAVCEHQHHIYIIGWCINLIAVAFRFVLAHHSFVSMWVVLRFWALMVTGEIYLEFSHPVSPVDLEKHMKVR